MRGIKQETFQDFTDQDYDAGNISRPKKIYDWFLSSGIVRYNYYEPDHAQNSQANAHDQ